MHAYIHTSMCKFCQVVVHLMEKNKPGKRPRGQFNYRLNGLPTSSGDDFWTKPEHRQWSAGASRDRPVGGPSRLKDEQTQKLRDGNVLDVLPQQQEGQYSCSTGGQGREREAWRLEGGSYRALVNRARTMDFIPVAVEPPWARRRECFWRINLAARRRRNGVCWDDAVREKAKSSQEDVAATLIKDDRRWTR